MFEVREPTKEGAGGGNTIGTEGFEPPTSAIMSGAL
jgi:hypothetical protein